MFNYNIFHKKNTKIQKSVINEKNYVYQSLIRLIMKYFGRKGDVIDFGCGVGTIDFYLANKGHSVLGIDISSKAIELARSSSDELKMKNIHFECLNIESLMPTVKYDYVICSEVIEHVEDDKKMLQRVHRSLKKSGIALISTPLSTAPLYRWGMLNEFEKRVGHLRRYTKDSLLKLCAESGLEIAEIYETEGLLRNLLFTNDKFSYLLKFAKWPISILFNIIDRLLVLIFGASNIYLVLKKKV